jgi:hypothetical protein
MNDFFFVERGISITVYTKWKIQVIIVLILIDAVLGPVSLLSLSYKVVDNIIYASVWGSLQLLMVGYIPHGVVL